MNGRSSTFVKGSLSGGPLCMEGLPPCKVIRSGRRSMAIEIRPGEGLLMRLPHHVGDGEALRFLHKHRQTLQKRLLEMASLPPAGPPTAEEVAALKRRAGELLPPLLAKWSQRLGLTPAGFRVTSAKTRFGSCSARGRLCFSYLLMRYPTEAIDYVVLHEVCHLEHMNHGAGFYRLLGRHMPDYKERRALLRALPAKREEA